jgi:hypothetical protein
MRLEFRGSLSDLATVAIGLVSTVGFAFLLGIPEMFGISLGWGWRSVDQGHTIVRAFTPKITEVKSRSIFLSQGEELVATYDFRLDSGRARVSVYTRGWIPAWGTLQTFYQNPNIRASTREEVRLVAPQSGFYIVSGSIVKATGTFTIDWQVEHSKKEGQWLRLGFAMGYFPLLLIALLILALGVAGVRALRD